MSSHVFPWATKVWNSYTKISSSGLSDEFQLADWEKGIYHSRLSEYHSSLDLVRRQLRYILHINSTVEGEQSLAQLLRAIPDKQCLFKYTRRLLIKSISRPAGVM